MAWSVPHAATGTSRRRGKINARTLAGTAGIVPGPSRPRLHCWIAISATSSHGPLCADRHTCLRCSPTSGPPSANWVASPPPGNHSRRATRRTPKSASGAGSRNTTDAGEVRAPGRRAGRLRRDAVARVRSHGGRRASRALGVPAIGTAQGVRSPIHVCSARQMNTGAAESRITRFIVSASAASHRPCQASVMRSTSC